MESAPDSKAPTGKPRTPWLVAAAAVAVVIAVVAVIVLLVNDSDDASPATTTGSGGTAPFAVSAAGLATLANAGGSPIYWAGPRNSKLYELTQKADGDVTLRYLPKGEKAGYKGNVLSVGTYPFKHAYAAAQATMARDDTVTIPVDGGALAFRAKSSSTNVYVVFPDVDVQIEVFSPEAGQAQKLVSRGEIVRVQ
jgi:hypothetical protein